MSKISRTALLTDIINNIYTNVTNIISGNILQDRLKNIADSCVNWLTDVDTDTTLASNSDLKVSSQKATKAYVTTVAATKQDTLVSASNIKTINGSSVLGSGDLTISGISGLTTNELVYGNSATTIASLPVSTYPSLTELSYSKGVTSAIQTQLNTKRNIARVTFSNANYTIVATLDSIISQIGTLSASRTVTLPLANSVVAGTEFIIQDSSGSATSVNTIVIARAGSNTINGATSETIAAPYGWRRLVSDGVSGWTFDGGVARLGGATFTGAISATNLSGTNTGDNATNSQYSGLQAQITAINQSIDDTAMQIYYSQNLI